MRSSCLALLRGWLPFRFWGHAFGLLLVFWLPIGLLQAIDGFLMFMTPREFALELPLLVLFVAALAIPFTLMATLTVSALSIFRVSRETRVDLGWMVLLAPLILLASWQWLRALRGWAGLVLGYTFTPPPWMKAAVVILVLALLVWLVARRSYAAWLGVILRALRVPARIAAGILVGSLLWTAVHPPELPGPSEGTKAKAVEGRPDIIFLSIDAASALDADWCSDEQPAVMPEMRALARHSTCFSRVYASSNFTVPTTATLETGLLPWSHANTQIAAKLPAQLGQHTLASTLRREGWRTFNLTDNILASSLQRGTWKGWDEARFHHAVPIDTVRGTLVSYLPGTHLPMIANSLLSIVGAFDRFRSHNPYAPEPLYGSLSEWLRASPGPVFAWVHSMPPHAPYLPPASTRHKLLPAGQLERWKDFMRQSHPYTPDRQAEVDKHRLRYRELMMSADAALGELIRELQRQGRFESSLVIVSSDHGESFERGYLGHAGTVLHEAVIRIPMLIKLPGQTVGRVVDQPVSQADIPATVLDVAGLAPLSGSEGRSLVPALRGETLARRPVFSMSLERQSRFEPVRSGHFAVILDNHKLIVDLKREASELYDLRLDPAERRNLISAYPERARELREQLDGALQRSEALRVSADLR